MDTDTLVKDLIDDGRKLIEELSRGGFEVNGAIWFKASDNGKWSFYVVTPLVETEGILEAYRRLHPLVYGGPEPSPINPLEIKLIGPSSPLGRDVLDILSRNPRARVSPFRWPGIWLGNMSIEAAYIYPTPVTTP